MNRRGHPQTLVARHPGNSNATKVGVHSERVRLERAQERLEQLQQLPHFLPEGHPLLATISGQLALIDLIDEDLASRGPTDRHGRVRSIVDLRDRAVGRLLRLLEAAGLTPEGQQRLEAEADRRALAEDIAQLAETGGKSNPVDDVLKTIAFRPQTSMEQKMGALRLLSDRQDRRARRQLQESAIDLRARGF